MIYYRYRSYTTYSVDTARLQKLEAVGNTVLNGIIVGVSYVQFVNVGVTLEGVKSIDTQFGWQVGCKYNNTV